MPASILVIACGALAREIGALKTANGWDHLDIQCLDAALHNRPDEIPGRVEATLERYAKKYDCLLYTSPSPRDATLSRMPSSA